MILTSKQLEELENVHDATGALSEADDEAGKEEGAEAALDWRLQLIEEAAEAIKHAKARPLDESMTYESSSLLFDRETRRFGRVMVSVPGYLRIEYLNGGDREWGLLDVEAFLTEFGSQRSLGDLADQLGFSDDEVLAELERLGITPLEEPEREGDAPDAAAAASAAALLGDDAAKAGAESAEAPASKPARKKAPKADAAPTGEAASPPKRADKPAKPSAKKAAKAEPTEGVPSDDEAAAAAAAKVKAAPEKPKAEARTGPNGEDPNSYIKKNFKKMSNRELSAATGLSEHTIRRKLGEWGLKRKK